MFATLTGTVNDMGDGRVIIDVNGVGYLVAVSSRTRARLDPGAVARVLIDTQVREDAINLYGFADVDEQAWFRLLTSVQGVGAKVALAILSACSTSEIAMAIAAQDKAMLTRADGVGPKLGIRIVTELKDKVPDYMGVTHGGLKPAAPVAGAKTAIPTPASVNDSSIDADAMSALVNLGYARAEAFAAVMKVKGTHTPGTVGEMIKLALNELTRSAA